MKTTLLSLVITVFAAGCSYSTFSNLADKAPAAQVNQDDSDINSSSFGDHIVGRLWPDRNGGLLAVTGNGSAAFAKVDVTGGGGVSIGHAEKDDLDDNLDKPNRITAMAGAPSEQSVGTAKGPFVYVGSTAGDVASIRVLDAATFRLLQGGTYSAPADIMSVAEFGLSVTPATLDDAGNRNDLAVGAKDAVVLLGAGTGNLSWPAMDDNKFVTVADSGAADWPSGGVSVIAAGNLDESTPEDEIVAAVPEKNSVIVIHHTKDCFTQHTKLNPVKCTSYIKIREDSANRFGSALLVADVDNDGKPELVVGASDVDKVYVYDLDATFFQPNGPTPSPSVVSGPTDAKEFGASLAFGKVDGGTRSLLVVGAPGTEVAGKASAGRIYLFDSNFKEVGAGVELVSPEDKARLGRRLAVVPYKKEGIAQPLEVLAASGRDAVFVFFANLTADHKDMRN